MTGMRTSHPSACPQTDQALCNVADAIALRIHPQREQSTLPTPAAHHWSRVDGSPWMQRHDVEAGSLLRLPGLADFLINASGTIVDAWPAPGLDAGTCHQLYLNNAMPMALSRQGKLVLHASAVEVGDQAIAFVGVSGRGKSTLATWFASNGHALLVDDGLLAQPHGDHFMAMPGEHSVRLWRDSEQLLAAGNIAAAEPVGYTSKRRIPAGDALRFSAQPRPLSAIFLLGNLMVTSATLQRLPPAQALMELLHHSFLLDAGQPRRHAAHMRLAAALAATSTFTLLNYPRDYAHLPQVGKTVRAHAVSPGPA